MYEVSGLARCMEELEEDKRKAEATLEAINLQIGELYYRLVKLEGANEKVNSEFGAMAN